LTQHEKTQIDDFRYGISGLRPLSRRLSSEYPSALWLTR
jgi:hypothetical protein